MFKLETHLLFDRSKAADKTETLSPYNLHCDGVRPVIRESAVILFLLSIRVPYASIFLPYVTNKLSF